MNTWSSELHQLTPMEREPSQEHSLVSDELRSVIAQSFKMHINSDIFPINMSTSINAAFTCQNHNEILNLTNWSNSKHCLSRTIALQSLMFRFIGTCWYLLAHFYRIMTILDTVNWYYMVSWFLFLTFTLQFGIPYLTCCYYTIWSKVMKWIMFVLRTWWYV